MQEKESKAQYPAKSNFICVLPVIVKDTFLLDGRKEYVVRAFSTMEEDGNDYLFVPDHENLGKRDIISADGVICNQITGFPIRVFNVTNDSRKLFQNTRVGWLTSISIQTETDIPNNELVCSMQCNAEAKNS